MALKGMLAPVADFDTQVFWDGLKEDKVLIQYCGDCKTPRWPPGPMCPECASQNIDWREAPKKGKLYSWTIATHPVHPALTDQVPYVLAMVELADKCRLVGNIVNWTGQELKDGQELSVIFEDREDGVRIYNFKL